MLLSDSRLVFRGVRPLRPLGDLARLLNVTDMLGRVVEGFGSAAPAVLRLHPPDPWPGDAVRGRDIIGGVFSFAGETFAREDLSWEPPGAGPEWLTALHGFEWLRDLRAVGGDRARKMARDMVSLWIGQYKSYDEAAWQPDILGTRLKSWICFHDFFCASADDDFRRAYFSSLTVQARHLAKALPGALTGVPLMRAARGLAYAGLALDGHDASLEQALDIIFGEISHQVLNDGGHVSRNPDLIVHFLRCLVDVRAALLAAGVDVPEDLQAVMARMAAAVRFFRHADGALALFNGGRGGNADLCEAVLSHVGGRGRAPLSLAVSGYERLNLGRAHVVMDTGLPMISPHNTRAHAGLLSFEFGFGKERILVNCGASTLSARWHRVLRSTLAHSTLAVDNRNAAALNNDGLLTGRPEVRVRRQDDGATVLLEASHDGYMRRFGLVHRRIVRLQAGGDVLSGEDQLAGRAGAPFAVRFHLHPDVDAAETDNGVLLTTRGGTAWRFAAEHSAVHLEESIYAAGEGLPRPTLQMVVAGTTAGATTVVRWGLRREAR